MKQTMMIIIKGDHSDREVGDLRRGQPPLHSVPRGAVAGSSLAREVGEVQEGRLVIQLRAAEVLGPKHQGDVEVLPGQLHALAAVVQSGKQRGGNTSQSWNGGKKRGFLAVGKVQFGHSHVRTHAHTRTNARTYTHTYTHAYTHTYTHAHTHTCVTHTVQT